MTGILKELNQRPIVYYPIYKEITGSLTAGVLLSQLMYWFSKKSKIFKTDNDIISETCLTVKELRNAKTKLKNVSFIKVTREGIPAKTYYAIDWEEYYNTLAKLSKTDKPKGKTQISPKVDNRLAQMDITDKPKGQTQISPKGETITEITTEITTENKNIKDNKDVLNKKNTQKKEKALQEFITFLADNKMRAYRDKFNIKSKNFDKALKELSISLDDLDLDEVVELYCKYLAYKRNYAKRLDKFIYFYVNGNLDELGLSHSSKSSNSLKEMREFLDEIFKPEMVKKSKAYIDAVAKYKSKNISEQDILDYIRLETAIKRFIDIEAYLDIYLSLKAKFTAFMA